MDFYLKIYCCLPQTARDIFKNTVTIVIINVKDMLYNNAILDWCSIIKWSPAASTHVI